MKLPMDQLLHGSITHFFAMHKEITYLGLKADAFTVKQINVQIIKMLLVRAMTKDVENGGEDLTMEKEIIACMDELDTHLRM